MSKIKYYNILLLILIFLFILLFIVFLIYSFNKIIKFRVIKDYIIPIEESTEEDLLYYNNLKHKYDIKSCKQICKQEICTDFENQKIQYDLCKECNKENKCYDPDQGTCITCKNYYTCEQVFGCNKSPPIDPKDNFCTPCWLKR